MTQPLDLLDPAVREVRKHLGVDCLLPWALDCERKGGICRVPACRASRLLGKTSPYETLMQTQVADLPLPCSTFAWDIS